MSLNCWCFVGNLARDAESRFLPDGTAILSFTAAVKCGFGHKESTAWAKCSMFGKRGESLAQYLTKGTQVAVTGELSMREWQDKEGQKQISLEVRVNDLTLLGKKDAKDQAKVNGYQKPTPTAPIDFSEDVPF